MRLMKNIFLIGLLSFLFSGCGDKICDCFDGCDDAILFTFDNNASAQSFKPEEIDTVLLYKLAKGQSNILDSAVFIRNPNHSGFVINNSQSNYCYSGASWISLDYYQSFSRDLVQDFDYQIVVPQLKSYSITNIEIEGDQPKGDCSCYVNTKKLVTVNGTQYDLTGKDPQQNAIVLTK